MAVIGHGVDIIGVEALAERLRNEGEPTDWLTAAECESLPPEGSRRATYVAGRIAAKEAVAKALGTGFTMGVTWADIEILNNSTGQPTVRLLGRALEIAESKGVTGWLVSISHNESQAIGSAIAVQEYPGD